MSSIGHGCFTRADRGSGVASIPLRRMGGGCRMFSAERQSLGVSGPANLATLLAGWSPQLGAFRASGNHRFADANSGQLLDRRGEA